MAFRSDSRWDLSVDNRSGQLTLAVEVKRKMGTSPEWVAKFRRNILAHGTFPQAPYFLMVFPDRFYLWTQAEAQPLEATEPNYTIDARPILEPYFKRAGVTADQLSEHSLELIVTAWLGEVIYSEPGPESMAGAAPWLLDSGLSAALAGGRFEREAAA
jgi:hypothetical protein